MLFSIWFFKFCTWYCYTLSSLFIFDICPLCLFTTVVCLFYVYNKLHKIYLYFTALENHPNQSKVRTLQIELLKSIGEIVFISQRKKKKNIYHNVKFFHYRSALAYSSAGLDDVRKMQRCFIILIAVLYSLMKHNILKLLWCFPVNQTRNWRCVTSLAWLHGSWSMSLVKIAYFSGFKYSNKHLSLCKYISQQNI